MGDPDTSVGPALVLTTPAGSLAWMRRDLRRRLLPFAGLTLAICVRGRPRWLGLGPGRPGVQLGFGAAAAALLFPAGAGLRLLLARRGNPVRVPASGADAALQAAYFLLNAPLEEAVFRGLLQSGLCALAGPAAGLPLATAAYVLYHRLGGWAWPDVLATGLVGAPLALAFRRLPGPPSLLGVSIAHAAATCGFLGPGPWLLRRARRLG